MTIRILLLSLGLLGPSWPFDSGCGPKQLRRILQQKDAICFTPHGIRGEVLGLARQLDHKVPAPGRVPMIHILARQSAGKFLPARELGAPDRAQTCDFLFRKPEGVSRKFYVAIVYEVLLFGWCRLTEQQESTKIAEGKIRN